MIYKDKKIWDKSPLVKPRITLKNDYEMAGKIYQEKWSLTPNLRIISHNYFIFDLDELKEVENFFYEMKGRLNSFFIPSHTKDLIAIIGKKGDKFFSIKKQNKTFWIYNQNRFLLTSRDFATKIIDVKPSNINKAEEIIFLEDALPYDINKFVFIEELICVRFNSDKMKITKNGATGYQVNFDFKEVFYE